MDHRLEHLHQHQVNLEELEAFSSKMHLRSPVSLTKAKELELLEPTKGVYSDKVKVFLVA